MGCKVHVCLHLISMCAATAGGTLGDKMARQLPNTPNGRILTNQLSVLIGLPLSFLLLKGKLALMLRSSRICPTFRIKCFLCFGQEHALASRALTGVCPNSPLQAYPLWVWTTTTACMALCCLPLDCPSGEAHSSSPAVVCRDPNVAGGGVTTGACNSPTCLPLLPLPLVLLSLSAGAAPTIPPCLPSWCLRSSAAPSMHSIEASR